MNTAPSLNRSTREKLFRAGFATKGVVYCLAGILTTFSALRWSGGRRADTRDTIRFVAEQPFGTVLLVLMAVGLFGYAFWRLYQAFKDPEHKENSNKRLLARIGYGISGLFYGFLAYYALRLVSGNGGSGTSREGLVSQVLSMPAGPFLVGLLALVFFGKAIYQFYKAYTGKYADKVRDGRLPAQTRRMVHTAGKIGYVSRGIVIGIIAYLLLRAAIEANPNRAGGTDDAFGFLEQQGGSLLMMIVALGLVGYGIFMFVKARYRDMSAV